MVGFYPLEGLFTKEDYELVLEKINWITEFYGRYVF
jgi:hypothetical protein